MRKITIIILLLFTSYQGFSQVVVSRVYPNNSITYLVNGLLLGNGLLASNITYSGADTAVGYFNGINSNIGMDSGVIITNCAVTDVPGPNTELDDSYSWSDCNTHTDSDLAQLIGVSTTSITSSAILQFDFTPYSDSIKFEYAFGSEEYPDYVGSEFNDVFGFFLSGPGIAGPFSNSAENIALIPGTTTPVSINNVNCSSNYTYYICNQESTSGTCSAGCPTLAGMSSTTVQFGGFTVPLMAKAAVECGHQYHIKLAIANVGDCELGSGVFLKSGSFITSGTVVSSKINFNHGFSGDSLLYRGSCDAGELYFERTIAAASDTIWIDTSGTASPGVDYNAIPHRIILPVGIYGDTLQLNAYPTTSVGIRTIKLSIIQRSCGSTDTQRVTVYIDSNVTISQPPLATCYGGGVTITPVVKGGYRAYTYSWNNGATTSSISVNNLQKDTTFILHVTDACSNLALDTIYVSSSAPTITTNSTPITCPKDQVTLTAYETGPQSGITYTWQGLGTGSSKIVRPDTTITYYVTIHDSCGNQTTRDSVTVNISVSKISVSIYPDTITTCKGDRVSLNANVSGGVAKYNYRWSPSGLFSDTLYNKDSANAYIYGNTSAIYRVKIIDYCGDTIAKNVIVNVLPDCDVVIPNVITPNADGTNDYFYIKSLELFPNSKLMIYDRWGKNIYEADNYQNNWDGTSSGGDKLSDGVYYYILYLSNGKNYTGFVQLIR